MNGGEKTATVKEEMEGKGGERERAAREEGNGEWRKGEGGKSMSEYEKEILRFKH